MNEELAEELVKEIGGGKTKFFETNVLETESIEAAVKGTMAWVKETGKEVGGVIAAAGVSTPAKVSSLFFCKYRVTFIGEKRIQRDFKQVLDVVWLVRLGATIDPHAWRYWHVIFDVLVNIRLLCSFASPVPIDTPN